MADTPTDSETPTAAPKRARKPRGEGAAAAKPAKAAKPRAAKADGAEKPAAAPRTRAAASKASAKTTTAKPASKRATSTRKATGSTSARTAKAVKDVVTEVAEAGSSRKKVVIGVAALAGVAAGVAAIYGRKKLIDASTDALEAVTGGGEKTTETTSPANSAD